MSQEVYRGQPKGQPLEEKAHSRLWAGLPMACPWATTCLYLPLPTPTLLVSLTLPLAAEHQENAFHGRGMMGTVLGHRPTKLLSPASSQCLRDPDRAQPFGHKGALFE